jgi:hypothetical protein
MTALKNTLFWAACMLSALAIAGNVDFKSLKILEDLPAGLWQSTFVATPADPNFPARTETQCISQAQRLAEMAATIPNGDCPTILPSNFRDKAIIEHQCPAIVLPVGGSIPAFNMRVTLTRPAANDRKITAVMNDGQREWRTTFTYLGKCP